MTSTLTTVQIPKTKISTSINTVSKIDINWAGRVDLPNMIPESSPEASAPSKTILTQSFDVATIKMKADDAVDQSLTKFDTPNNQTIGFGPHLLTSNEAIQIGHSAQIMIDTAKDAVAKLNIAKNQRVQALAKIPDSVLDDIQVNAPCPFTAPPSCDTTSKYRTADGSCNNLQHPLWGKSLTPFERFIPSLYEDGLDQPRSTDINGDPLPGARTISFKVHTDSDATTQMNDLSHFSMEFGQFISHDIQMNALSKGLYNSNLNCCLDPTRRNCFPIAIPADDPFYRAFNRTCLNFVRALPTTDLECSLGDRQQLNQNTHFIDGSAMYGSDKVTADSLREFSGGRLQSSTGGELLPKDIPNTASCILPSDPNIKCFRAGDPRVNQQPALMAIQTIWMKQHNRIANQLTQMNGWTDEEAYQEARKIVGAMIQHITYNEYLPNILGNQAITDFDLQPKPSGYFTGYNSTVKPQIRNAFAAAAFRFGHSMVQQRLSYNGPLHANVSPLLHDEFQKPDKLYDTNGGVSSITRGLYEDFSQKVDRKLTKELTERLFERTLGFGGDLAAINIQRGRDHGLASYNIWRLVCDLTPADDFTPGVAGGLEHHSPEAALALENVYRSPWDVDLFSGGVSETPVNGGKVGPTFACLIGLQFRALKFGDRFFYESDTNVKFTPEQLTEIKKTTMARIICDNTNINSLPADVFRKTSVSNPERSCGSAQIPVVDLQKWRKCVDGGWSPFVKSNSCIWSRKCNNPQPNSCGKPCVGSPYQFSCVLKPVLADQPILPVSNPV